MKIKQLRHQFATPSPKSKLNLRTFFWLTLSFAFSVLCSSLALQKALSYEYAIQEDALQHVFWMRRFLDADLFPNDLIADYFQSVAPWGYTAFYWLFAKLGVDPVYLSKLLPTFLGLITTGYCFWLCLEIFPVPLAGFLSSVLLNQFLWLRDDIVSATPTAFVYPIFTAFLYYLVRRSLVPCAIAIALMGLFYPQAVLIIAGILVLRLLDWHSGKLRLATDRNHLRLHLTGLGVSLVVILIYALKTSEYEPVITLAEARTMPEFAPGGRVQFFFDNPWRYWLFSTRGGIIATLPAFGHLLGLIAIPFILLNSASFPLLKEIKRTSFVLLDVTLASVGLFLMAHATLFRLYLPSRYTEHSLRVVIAILVGIFLTILINGIIVRFQNNKIWQRSLTAIVLIFVVANSFFFETLGIEEFPITNYFVGRHPAIYTFFQQQPKDIVIASLSDEVSFIPTFARRSILVSSLGYPVPYHQGYYSKFLKRTDELIEAQYSLDLKEVQEFQQKYSIDFWLMEESAFSPEYLQDNQWTTYHPSATESAIANLQQDQPPAITRTLNQCTVFQTEDYSILDANCIQNFSES